MKKLIRDNRIKKAELLVDETIFSVANGYLGIRGTFTEGYGTDFEYNQTYLNGFYDYYDYFYEENLTGFPQRGQKFVNLIDGQIIEFIVNNVAINISSCEVISLKREYDLSLGMTKRRIHYKTLDNYEFIINERKIVSSKFKDLIAIEMNFESVNYNGEVLVKSYLQESIKKEAKGKDPRVHTSNTKHLEITEVLTKKSRINSKTASSNLLMTSSIYHSDTLEYEGYINKIVGKKVYDMTVGNSINLVKYIIHTSSLYDKDYVMKNNEVKEEVIKYTFDDLLVFQKSYFTDFWDTAYIKVDSDEFIESILNYNLYQINCSGGESSLHNIAAKGLSGEGYEGHYFWDTEIYLVPFFALTNPEKAKKLLMYRYRILDQARNEAINLGYTKGAKIPWRTINGDETSPYYPAGSAQFHINSDVAYAIIKYFELTNDIEFMVNFGFELLFETARFLMEALDYKKGADHLNGVTGPDEYTTVVDDNYYTNQMLKYHFKNTYDIYNEFKDDLYKVIQKIEVTDEEIEQIFDVSNKINLPFDKELNIYAQDSSFLKKKKLDLKSIPDDKFPLLLNYHPLYLYKHQVLKQADTLLSMVLLDFEDESIYRDSFNYYEPITTHDSSLSKCIYSIAAFKLGYEEIGSKYFKEVLETDLLNNHKNTQHGLHVANLGGSYLGIVYGVLGLRIHKDYLSINPILTKEIKGYEINIIYRGSKIKFKVGAALEIESEKEVLIRIFDRNVLIEGYYRIDLQQ
jgi:alpha,alpha-trehalose phosphorylase